MNSSGTNPGADKKITYSDITDFEELYESSYKCRRGVGWKPSTKHHTLNGVERCLEMEAELRNGTWKHGKPRPIMIRYPKKREGLSIPFRDRVYQRALNDLALYPMMTKSFILDNCACQKGKGTDFARKRMKKHLWKHFCHHGRKGYVLQVDIRGYYPNMRHDVVDRCFARHLPPEIHAAAMSVLKHQYKGETGYNPGSQMVQIAGISVLDGLDHHIKEQLYVRHYIRYMDDLWMLFASKEEAEAVLLEVKAELEKIGFSIHEEKTHIRELGKGFLFLGYWYHMTATGKIVMTINSDSVRHERRKLRRMASRVAGGLMPMGKMRECYESWRNFASIGNCYRLAKRMDRYYHQLVEEIRNGNIQKPGHVTCRREDDGHAEGVQ